jgi:SAM-dependent methyltransferase
MSASRHYLGTSGTVYHEYQQQLDPGIRGRLGARKFEPFLPVHIRRLVDFGCGPGTLLAALHADERVGVDPIAENRARVESLGFCAYETLSELEDAWADVAVSNHALEHTLDPLGELRELRRVLRGRLVLYVPADDWRVTRSYQPSDINHHLFTWTPLALGHLLAEAGFVVRSTEIVHRAWPGRLTEPLAQRLSQREFDLVSAVYAFLRRRREILAIAD